MRLPALALAAAVLALPLPGLAQSPPSAPPAAAGEKPQGISREDYIKRAADRAGARFDRMDTDHDGVLTRDEIRAWRETHHRSRRHGEPNPDEEAPPKQQ